MNYNKLDQLSIYELRNYARSVGVYNPTVLKKNDLIQAIIDVETGKVKPHIKPKQGRPPKEIGQLVSLFMPEDIVTVPTHFEKYYERKNEVNVFSQNYEKQGESDDYIIYKGYLEILSTGSGLLRKRISLTETENERCYIKPNMIDAYGLKHGDEIVCNAYSIGENRPLVCDSIISINNISLTEFPERYDYNDMKNVYEKNKINVQNEKLNQLGLYYGDTIYCYNNRVQNFINFAVDFAVKNKSLFDKIIYLSPVALDDEQELLKSFPDELYLSNFNENFSCQQRTIFMAVSRAKRLAELGQNVCLIIQDILGLVHLDNSNNGDLPITKDILSCAKNLESGSLTIMCGYCDIKFPYLRAKVNNTFPLLESCGLTIQSYGVDIENSYRRK